MGFLTKEPEITIDLINETCKKVFLTGSVEYYFDQKHIIRHISGWYLYESDNLEGCYNWLSIMMVEINLNIKLVGNDNSRTIS